MLISFSLRNFKSFLERAELSLVPKKSDRTVRGALLHAPMPGTGSNQLLSAAAIYGANASGKSNFLLALRAMKRAVLNSQTEWKPTRKIPIDPHLLSPDEPTEFEIQLIADGVRYRYGFIASADMFTKEWLYSYPKGRERELFVRTTVDAGDSYEISVEMGNSLDGLRRDHEAITRRLRNNSLFLSAGAQDNQAECAALYKWFSATLRDKISVEFGENSRGFTSSLAHDFERFRKLLYPVMRIADGSIANIHVEHSGDTKSPDDVDEFMESLKKYSVEFELSDGEKTIVVDHERESRGVKRLYSLAAELISALAFGHVLIIDELETSMHSHVASQILALFQNKASNPKGSQIIFTTHETRLLNLQHLRRDQIWFCDRQALKSSMYSLLEFSPRKDENFEIAYLRGRYGAVPRVAVDPSWIKAINEGKDYADVGAEEV